MYHLVKGQKGYFNINLYKGEIRMSKREGFGLQLFPNGCYYLGYWRNDRAYGNGKLVLPDGTRYEGLFNKNILYKGTISYFNEMKYEGELDRTPYERFRKGKLTFSNGYSLKGEWKEGKLEKGYLIDQKGREIKIGNKDVIVKDTKAGFENFGVIISKHNKWLYQGLFEKNECKGKGTILNTFQQYKQAFFDKDKVEGFFKKVSLIGGEIIEGKCVGGERKGFWKRMTNKGYQLSMVEGHKTCKIAFPYINEDFFEGEIDFDTNEKKPYYIKMVKGTYHHKKKDGKIEEIEITNIDDIFTISQVKMVGINFHYTYNKIFNNSSNSPNDIKNFIITLIDKKLLTETQLSDFLLRIYNPDLISLDQSMMSGNKSIFKTELQQITRSKSPSFQRPQFKNKPTKTASFLITDNQSVMSKNIRKTTLLSHTNKGRAESFNSYSDYSNLSIGFKPPNIKRKSNDSTYNINVLPISEFKPTKYPKKAKKKIQNHNYFDSKKFQEKQHLKIKNSSKRTNLSKGQKSSQQTVKFHDIESFRGKNNLGSSQFINQKAQKKRNTNAIEFTFENLDITQNQNNLLSPMVTRKDVMKSILTRGKSNTVRPRKIRNCSEDVKTLFDSKVLLVSQIGSYASIKRAKSMFIGTRFKLENTKSNANPKKMKLQLTEIMETSNQRFLSPSMSKGQFSFGRNTKRRSIDKTKKNNIVQKVKQEIREKTVYKTIYFQGKLIKGLMQGYCKLMTSGQIYKVGYFKDDIMQGRGYWVYPHGVRVEGNFINGIIKGNGSLYVNNRRFEGFFEGKKFTNPFIKVFKNLSVLISEHPLINGKASGFCSVVLKEGYTLEGQFDNGKIMLNERCNLSKFGYNEDWIGKVRMVDRIKVFESFNSPRVAFEITESEDFFIFKEIKGNNRSSIRLK